MTSTARTFAAVLAVTSAGAFALPAIAEEMKFMAELTGAAQVPPVDTEAVGMADVTVDTEAMTVTWTLTHEGLSGEPVAAHFHGPATPEETAPPVVDMTMDMEENASAAATATVTTDEGTATATDTTEEEIAQDIMEGSAELTAEQLADLQAGLYYINIHTEAHPDGEIRGQVVEGEAQMGEATTGGAAVMEGEAIRAAVAGNTVHGNMLDSGAYSEFYAADGVIKGDGYTGTWSIEGDAMCFDYGEEEATCWQARVAGDQITWVLDGADVGDGTIVPGNPNSF